MYFYVFGSFDVFMHVFKNRFYKNVKNMAFYVFYLQINVFNIHGSVLVARKQH